MNNAQETMFTANLLLQRKDNEIAYLNKYIEMLKYDHQQEIEGHLRIEELLKHMLFVEQHRVERFDKWQDEVIKRARLLDK